MKVIFRPSLQEHIDFLTAWQKRKQAKVSNAVTWIFFAFNLGFAPAMLLFNDLLWTGIVLFLLDALMMIFLLSLQQTNNLRKYYHETWPELEEHDCEIRIDENGVESEHAGNRNSFPWTNIRTIGATDKMIYFDVGTTQVLVSKRGFSDQQEANRFVDLPQGYKRAQSKDSE